MDRSGYKHRKHIVHPAKPIVKPSLLSDDIKGWLIPIALGVFTLINYIIYFGEIK